MFTISQIGDALKKVKSGADFPSLVHELKAMGVIHYDTHPASGRTIYYGSGNYSIDSGNKYAELPLHPVSSGEKLKHAIAVHQQGKTDYPAFCTRALEAGVKKWRTSMLEMTVTYYDANDGKLLVEDIPTVRS